MMKTEDEKIVEEVQEAPAKKPSPKKEAPVKRSAMDAEFDHLAGYQTKIKYGNVRVVLHMGVGTPTEEQIDLPHIAGGIKAHFSEK